MASLQAHFHAAEPQRADEAQAAAAAAASVDKGKLPPTGAGVRLLSESLLAVRIPRFQKSKGALASHVGYSVVVEQPGGSRSITKRYSEFQQLHEELSKKPFGSSLPALPEWKALANFNPSFLEQRRQQLQAYLAFLCMHSLVMLDPTLSNWLGLEGTARAVIRVAVAHACDRSDEAQSSMEALEAAVVGEQSEGCCLHPMLLEALRGALLHRGSSERVLCATCRLLRRLLVMRQARLLFLSTSGGGVAALLHVHQRGGAAGEAAQETLQAACELGNAEQEPVPTAARSSKPITDGSQAELGECCICLDRGRSHAFLPCGHLSACMECAACLRAQGGACPICRCRIERTLQIFL